MICQIIIGYFILKTKKKPDGVLFLFQSAFIDDSANTIAKRHVRVTREAAEPAAAQDQVGAESAPQPDQDLNAVDDQDRNKRYSPFGGGDDDGHTGAGSGNFLFDIIRVRRWFLAA